MDPNEPDISIPGIRDDDDVNRVISKLTKINAALMKRVERSMDQQANAFSLFQTAINQEAQIQQRTEQLNNALNRLAKVNDELREARDVAQQANIFKTRFFTAVGHDLLQPLHAARLTLSELKDVQTQPANKKLATNIGYALNNIEELLTSILDISKLEAGVFVPNFQTVSLSDLFERLTASLEPMTRHRGLKLRCRPTRLGVKSDPLMLRRMIQNLLVNAANYTQSGGLLLAARHRGSRVFIEVWDTGPGIDAADQKRIFGEFQQGAQTRGGGFGLGLAIVRRMAEALDHKLELKSRVGNGSRFRISAPFAEPPRREIASTETISPPAATFSGQPVFVIDNDLSVLEAMQTLLTRWGADVRLARDIDEIDDIVDARSFQPVIILADYHLDRDVLGLEAIQKIREICGRNIPSILITADHTDQTARAAREAGSEILHKPVRPGELRALMQHMIGK